MAGYPRSLAFMDPGFRESHGAQAPSARAASPCRLFPHFVHNDLRSHPSNIVPGRPLRAANQPEEAKTTRNSLSWNILQGTSLFSIFCSATLPVTSRKQGFCVQSMGGGTQYANCACLTRIPCERQAAATLHHGRHLGFSTTAESGNHNTHAASAPGPPVMVLRRTYPAPSLHFRA
jgi:hypothetical protein